MNDTELRELFEEILGDDPHYDMPVDDDVARGRLLRARLRHRRATAAAMVATSAVALGVVLVPWWMSDAAPGPDGPTGSIAGRTIMSADRPDESTTVTHEDTVSRDIWNAIEQTLPADVQLADGGIVSGGESPRLFVTLERDDVEFDLAVWLQNAPPNLKQVGICERETGYALCSEGTDATGRWRVVAAGNGGDGLAVLEDGRASVTLRWEPTTAAAPGADFLAEAEIDALTEAVLDVGAQHAKAELISGIDLSVLARDWADVRVSAEEALDIGPLRSKSGVDVTIDEEASQAGSASMMLESSSGTSVQMTVRQAAWPHELCDDSGCGGLPLDDRDGDKPAVDITRTASSVQIMTWVDHRAILSIEIRPADDEPSEAKLAHAARAIAAALPRLSR